LIKFQQIKKQFNKKIMTEFNLYLKNCQASFVKKLAIKINDKAFHTISASIPENQVILLSGVSDSTTIKLEIRMPAKNFFDAIEEEFDLATDGNHILIEVVVEGDESNISFANQSDEFTFE
jgi:hypothetical protein